MDAFGSIQILMPSLARLKKAMKIPLVSDTIDPRLVNMTRLCELVLFSLAGLVAATPRPATVTVSVYPFPASRPSPATTAPIATGVNASGVLDNMTIAITNAYGDHLSLSFTSNVGAPAPLSNPSAIMLPDKSLTQYIFPTGWAGKINVGPNINPLSSKIEGSLTGPPDVDVSYVDGYSVPITCSSEGTPITGCNIELFQQPGVTCDEQVDGPICLNNARYRPQGPAPPFFAACAGAAYTYPDDDKANVGNLKSKLVSCCIGKSCLAPSRQLSQR